MNIPLQVADEASDTDSNVQVGANDAQTGAEDNNSFKLQLPQPNVNADGDDEASQSNGTASSRPGIDEVLRLVSDAISPAAAEVVRGLQRDFGNANALENRLQKAIEEVEDLRGELEEDLDSDDDPVLDALENVDPAQLELLEAVLQREGYVKQSELDEVDREYSSAENNREAVEMFGEDFGRMEAGEFVVSPTAKERMEPHFNRIINDSSLQFDDLYKISHFDDLIASARQQGRNEVAQQIRDKNGQRVGGVMRASGVANANASGNMVSSIYNPEELTKSGVPRGKARISEVLRKARQSLEAS